MSRSRIVLIASVFLCAAAAGAQEAPLRLKPGDRIVALGDSITQAGGYLRMMRRVLDRRYPELRVEIVNAGISGHKSTDMSERLRRDVIDKRPTIVTISCGVNDVWHGFYTPPRGVDLEMYASLMSRMVDELRASTRADIYLLTPTVIKEDLASPENRKLEAYCDAVRRIAAQKGCTLVDLNETFQLALSAARRGGGAGFHPTSDGVHLRPAGDFLMAASILRAFRVPMRAILEEAVPTPPQVGAGDARFQYWGRWDLRDAAGAGAVTVNTGSTIVAAFRGTGATLHFAVAHLPAQYPTLWLQVDESPWRVVAPAEELPLSRQPLAEGRHVVRVVVKGFREWERRWDAPLESSIVFRGASLEPGGALEEPPARPSRVIEYLGDSITEGVLVLNEGPRESWTRERWPEYSDGRRTWAYQSALALGAEPRIVGFGRLGLSINANGGVPPAIYSLPLVYAGAPIDGLRPPDAVVVNLGTNDRRAPAALFADLYRAYVDALRRQYPSARIFCLAPFSGDHRAGVGAAVAGARDRGDARVHFVDTTGWIDRARHTTDGVHLNLEGNRVAAERLAAVMKDLLEGGR